MANVPPYLDMRPIKKVDKELRQVILSWRDKCVEKRYKSLFLIVSKEFNDEFAKFLSEEKLQFEWIGFISDWLPLEELQKLPKDFQIPASGIIYRLTFS